MVTQIHFSENPFLSQLNFQVNHHLPDTELNVTKLLRLVGMSRTRFHEKLKQETGLSTTAYIRFLRLKNAAELLANRPDLNIFQIAESVGFGNQSYFTRRFQEAYKCTPKQFRKKSGKLENLEHT
jgi:AraC-like DNA-binding protein